MNSLPVGDEFEAGRTRRAPPQRGVPVVEGRDTRRSAQCRPARRPGCAGDGLVRPGRQGRPIPMRSGVGVQLCSEIMFPSMPGKSGSPMPISSRIRGERRRQAVARACDVGGLFRLLRHLHNRRSTNATGFPAVAGCLPDDLLAGNHGCASLRHGGDRCRGRWRKPRRPIRAIYSACIAENSDGC